ncbi:endonuclease V [Thermus scotoductus]|uniref:Endonuclease V n=1 Tax=Thermus scotoductus TaxID=37636 RepID=A0A430V671_THESC|nr:endonuclease V [Thermus scotoductus]RTI02664.1 endonuclease V [Thermus scotoductus]RTI20079.1 endonuclease V [Thermus scotoductus]
MGPFPEPKDLQTAMALQRSLAERVVLEGSLEGVRRIAALDASHRRGKPLVAVAVLYHLEKGLLCVGLGVVPEEALFPYIPGFLSFREAPAYLQALEALPEPPEALLVDGQGIAHPRGLGIASHLGVHLDLPSIGVAKSLLYGRLEAPLPQEAGSAVRLLSPEGRPLGYAYRSRKGVKPLFISPGHRVGLEEALAFVKHLPTCFRLPEPLRLAHLEAGKALRQLDP